MEGNLDIYDMYADQSAELLGARCGEGFLKRAVFDSIEDLTALMERRRFTTWLIRSLRKTAYKLVHDLLELRIAWISWPLFMLYIASPVVLPLSVEKINSDNLTNVNGSLDEHKYIASIELESIYPCYLFRACLYWIGKRPSQLSTCRCCRTNSGHVKPDDN